MFDSAGSNEHPDVVAARHGQAITLCQSCPALQRCTAWLDSLTPGKRPEGIVAGQLITPRPARRPAGATRKEAAS